MLLGLEGRFERLGVYQGVDQVCERGNTQTMPEVLVPSDFLDSSETSLPTSESAAPAKLRALPFIKCFLAPSVTTQFLPRLRPPHVSLPVSLPRRRFVFVTSPFTYLLLHPSPRDCHPLHYSLLLSSLPRTLVLSLTRARPRAHNRLGAISHARIHVMLPVVTLSVNYR